MKVLVCGSGAAAQATVSQLDGQSLAIWMLSLTEGRAGRLAQQMAATGLAAGSKKVAAAEVTVSSDPLASAASADVVVLATCARKHAAYLTVLLPHLPPRSLVVGWPGRPGFVWLFRELTAQCNSDARWATVDTLPWVCRLVSDGRQVDLLGPKATVLLATQHSAHSRSVADVLGALLGCSFSLADHWLSIELGSVGAYMHPVLMWCHRHHEGTPPLFYAVDTAAEQALCNASAEVMAVKAALEERLHLALGDCTDLKGWLERAYALPVQSTLGAALRGVEAYRHIRCPCTTAGTPALQLDVSHRYLADDVPCGLVVLRGLAEWCGVATPTLDCVLEWSQRVMGAVYLAGGRLVHGPSLARSRAPQHILRDWSTQSMLAAVGPPPTTAAAAASSAALRRATAVARLALMAVLRPAATLAPALSAAFVVGTALWPGGGTQSLLLIISLQLALNLPAFSRYYCWFYACGLPCSRQRGLGQSCGAVYGLFRPPKLTPSQFDACTAALLAVLLALALVGHSRTLALLAYALYFPLFGSLFLESKVGGHHTVLLPHFLFYLGVCPQLAVVLTELTIGAMYCSSALCKLWRAARAGRLWCDGITLQAYLLEDYVHRPAPSEPVRALTRALIRRPLLTLIMQATMLGFECLGVWVPFAPRRLRLAWAIVGTGMHAGAWALMGIDFMSFWVPFLAAFTLRDQREDVTSVLFLLRSDVQRSQPLGNALAVAYLACMLYHCFSFFCVRHNGDGLPFSSCPMFCEPRNMFSPTAARTWVFTSADMRQPGYIHVLRALMGPRGSGSAPQSPALLARTLKKLPFSTLVVSSTAGSCASERRAVDIASDLTPLPEDIVEAAHLVDRILSAHQPASAWSPCAVDKVIVALDHLRACYERHRARS